MSCVPVYAIARVIECECVPSALCMFKLFCRLAATERNVIGQKRSLTQWKPEHYSCIRIYTIAISVQCQL